MLPSPRPVHRVVDLVPERLQRIRNMSVEEARARLLSADPTDVLDIRGSFALVAREGQRVRLARSLDRPLRYFLAKEKDGPLLVVADRIDTLQRFLVGEGYGDQFHPTYTRMIPAHHVTELQLVGCPDPNPVHTRFFDPPMGTLSADVEAVGEKYVSALRAEIAQWLDFVPREAPLGVLFSGGVDSGLVLLTLHAELLARGEPAQRLKAFTLAVQGGGPDLEQARDFLRRTSLEFLLETVERDAAALDADAAVAALEDYKPLDVECAAMNLALLEGIRARYPDWRHLVDGDGGDENLKDYPIEENPELTIRSVVNNPMLYQEGWGVDAIKHSLTHTGGLSRGCARGWGPASRFGFDVFSPFTAPPVIAVAEAIPFAELTEGSHERLYALKGEVAAAGARRVLGVELPVFEKRRFQHGAVPAGVGRARLGDDPAAYRRRFLELYGA